MITHFPTTGASDLLLGILDGSPNGIVAYQPIRNEAGIIIDYETVYYNAQARMLLGYTDTDFRQGTLFQRFPAARALETAYMPLIQNNQPFIHESYFKRAGRWVQTQARRLGDGFFLIFSDITTRKEAEVSLIHRNQLLDGVINTFLSGITAFEPIMNDAGEVIDFRVTLVNDGALLLLGGGYTREQLLGNTLIQLYPETQEQGMFHHYLAVYRTGQSIRTSHFYPVPQKWIDLSIQKTETGLLVTYNDITEQKQAEQQLQQSANMLQNVLDGVQSGVISCKSVRDEKGHIIDFEVLSTNQQVCLIMQQPAEHLIGQRMLSLFPTKRKNGLFDRYVIVVETGEKQQIEQEFREDGLNAWFDITAIRQGDGLVLTLLDISERKQAQLDLARQKDQLTAIFESSPNGIIAMRAIRDDSGQPIDFLMEKANSTTTVMTGHTPDQIVGTRLLTTFPGNADGGFLAIYQRVVTTGQPEQATQYYRDEKGLEAWFNVSAVRQGSDNVVVTFSDVTTAQRTQQQLRESNESLEQFAGVASHDLQEPLRKVQSFGNLLSQQFGPQLGESGQDLIQRMQSAADRMSILIRDLLAYSRLTNLPDISNSLDLNVLVSEVLIDLETRVADKKAVIDISTLPTLRANNLTIRQLIQNLIGNALKFSRPGVRPHIRISAEKVRGKQLPASLPTPQASSYWAIRVADNGIGFDDQYKDRIFGAFQRLHSRNSVYPGTGIGLAIVKKVVEQHNGGIEARGQVGEGATFTVYLPA
ncbi:PAS domain-containing sensor histidine kinase [Fibrella forsythiae]|uniref:histidine kinase n=1 Tax=Fibrella forsythiae TaxID=2817061 RepID=A0ABS3JI19_9BACT|nr:PAS domain-containing protein [Fibrella forsythiae]MBO0949654.1 PAS domain-containing protein [Fibrella forsythiae]